MADFIFKQRRQGFFFLSDPIIAPNSHPASGASAPTASTALRRHEVALNRFRPLAIPPKEDTLRWLRPEHPLGDQSVRYAIFFSLRPSIEEAHDHERLCKAACASKVRLSLVERAPDGQDQAAEVSEVRTRLSAGGNWIRTFSSPIHPHPFSRQPLLSPLKVRQCRDQEPGVRIELSPNLGDGLRDQAAAVWDCEDAGLAATSIPSVNLTP